MPPLAIRCSGLAAQAWRPSPKPAEVFQAQLDTNAVPGGDGQHCLDAFGLGFVVITAARMLDIEEGVAEPDADVVASVGLELFRPGLEAREALGCRAER